MRAERATFGAGTGAVVAVEGGLDAAWKRWEPEDIDLLAGSRYHRIDTRDGRRVVVIDWTTEDGY